MTDQLPEQLRDVFESAAASADVPPLALQNVFARGQALKQVRRRRAALWTTAAAAAAVVVVSLPLALAGHHGHDDRPAPAHHTRSTSPTPPPANGVPTAPPTLPYLAGRVLHLGGRTITIAGRPNVLLSRGGTTLYFDMTSGRWWRVCDGKATPFGSPPGNRDAPWTGTFAPTVSADGRTIAVLTHPTQNTSRITEYDAATDTEKGHVDLDLPFANWTGGGDSVDLTGVDNAGQVFWIVDGADMSSWMWAPGDRPVKLGVTLDAAGVDYPPDGALTTDGAIVQVSFLGQTTRIGTVPDVENAAPVWSPSGALLATAGPAITRVGSGAAISPRWPDGAIDAWVGFESDAYVLGAAESGDGQKLIRCSTDTGACAAIGSLPYGWTDWKWAQTPPGTAPAVVAPPSSPPSTSASSPVDDSVVGLPRGDAPQIATITQGVLTVDGKPIARDVDDVIASSDQSVFLLRRRGTVSAISRAGKETALDALGGVIEEPPPVLSPDGSYAVAVHTGEHGDELVEWSLMANRLVGTMPVVGGAQRIRLDGVDDDGRVYATTYAPRSGFSWKPGGARQPLTGAAADLASVGFGAVGPHRVLEPSGCDGASGGISPSGSQLLCGIDTPPGLGVVSATTGRAVPLRLPAGTAGHARGIGFESDTDVLVLVQSPGPDWLVRCAVSDGTCERAAPVPAGTTFPTLPGVS